MNDDLHIHDRNRDAEGHSRSHDVEEEGDEHAALHGEHAEVGLDDQAQMLLDENAEILGQMPLHLHQTWSLRGFDGEESVVVLQARPKRLDESSGLVSGDGVAGGLHPCRHLPT